MDIFDDLAMGEGLNTGLDWLPVVKGRTVGPAPEAAKLPGGLPQANKTACETSSHRMLLPHRWLSTTLAKVFADADDEVVDNSLFAAGVDPSGAALKAVAGLDDVGKRVVGAIIGSLVGDAAAQPTHWNVSRPLQPPSMPPTCCMVEAPITLSSPPLHPTHIHTVSSKIERVLVAAAVQYAQKTYQQLLQAGDGELWAAPEFARPSLNAFYRVPAGTSSCNDNHLQIPNTVARSILLSTQEDSGAHFVHRSGPATLLLPLSAARGVLIAGGLQAIATRLISSWNHSSTATARTKRLRWTCSAKMSRPASRPPSVREECWDTAHYSATRWAAPSVEWKGGRSAAQRSRRVGARWTVDAEQSAART